MKIFTLCIICLSSLSLPCLASKLVGYDIVNFKSLPQAPKGENLTGEDIEKVVPIKKLVEEDDMGSISRKMLDQGVNSFLQSDYVQESSLGKTAKSVEEGVRTDIHFGSSDSDIKHKVSLQYQAFQQEAYLKYAGLLNFNIKYKFQNQDYVAEVVQNIDEKEFVLGHEVVTDDYYKTKADVSSMSVRWNW